MQIVVGQEGFKTLIPSKDVSEMHREFFFSQNFQFILKKKKKEKEFIIHRLMRGHCF